MEEKLETILNQFDNQKYLLDEFGDTTYNLIKSLLSNSNIKPHQISFRIKDKVSLQNKIIRKDFKYNKLNEITDLLGIRIITFFEDEIDIVAKILESEFEIDWQNSIDKRRVDADRFGYRSLHFVVSHKKSRTKLTEYSNFKELKCELQIRSILQHSWAEIEHDIGYKGEGEIPESAKRTFYRVAALLEQADIEFVKLKKEINEFEGEIKNEIESPESQMQITKSNLKAFFKESDELKKIEDHVNSSFCPKGDDFINIDDFLIERMNKQKIHKLIELNTQLANFGIEPFEKTKKGFKNDTKPSSFQGGAPILWLLNHLEELDDA